MFSPGPKTLRKFPALTPEAVDLFLQELLNHSIVLTEVPRAYTLDPDPKDESYLNVVSVGRRMEKRYLVGFASVAVWVAFGLGWNWYRYRKALPLLQRWAYENHYSIISSGFWGALRRRILMDRPPHWRWGAYPFRVTARSDAGQIEEGWVLCHREGVLAAGIPDASARSGGTSQRRLKGRLRQPASGTRKWIQDMESLEY